PGFESARVKYEGRRCKAFITRKWTFRLVRSDWNVEWFERREVRMYYRVNINSGIGRCGLKNGCGKAVEKYIDRRNAAKVLGRAEAAIPSARDLAQATSTCFLFARVYVTHLRISQCWL